MANYYCVIDPDTDIIYGIGHTKREAEKDAENYLKYEDDDSLDELLTAECSKAVYDYVIKHGGVGDFDLDLSREYVQMAMGFNAHRTFPKHKKGLKHLENSVRRMF